MNPQNLSVHAFDSHALRVIDREGEPWFVATDVASVLGYRDAFNMVRMLDEDEKGTHEMSIRSESGVEQMREVTVISESGLYACILKSQRPEAKAFRKWVTSEVLPSIRRSGGYQATASAGNPFPHNLNHRADNLVSADRSFRAALRSGRAVGLNTAQSIRRAQLITQNLTGVDLLAELGVAQPESDPAPSTPWQVQDSAARFYRAWQRLEVVAPNGTVLPLCTVRPKDLAVAYAQWCSENSEAAVSHARFACTGHKLPGWRLDKVNVWADGPGSEQLGLRVLDPSERSMAEALAFCQTGMQSRLMSDRYVSKVDWRTACLAVMRESLEAFRV